MIAPTPNDQQSVEAHLARTNQLLCIIAKTQAEMHERLVELGALLQQATDLIRKQLTTTQ